MDEDKALIAELGAAWGQERKLHRETREVLERLLDSMAVVVFNWGMYPAVLDAKAQLEKLKKLAHIDGASR